MGVRIFGLLGEFRRFGLRGRPIPFLTGLRGRTIPVLAGLARRGLRGREDLFLGGLGEKRGGGI